mmetsp:Transcript_13674/g.18519  ORF Transcript_13674/g.18519 Transcript_13674/m.18519 type:complete len:81 (+) Transcript_13674:127-369(+)
MTGRQRSAVVDNKRCSDELAGWTLSREAKRQDNKEGDMPPYSGVQPNGELSIATMNTNYSMAHSPSPYRAYTGSPAALRL